MIAVIALAAALWGIGRVVGAPPRLRWAMVGAVWLGAVLLHLVLPPDAPLRSATGGDARVWLALGVVGASIAGYRALLLRLCDRARPVEAPRRGLFSDTELDRYSRHILLREIGGPGQRALKQANVLVVGAGGLGSPLLLYLAAAGVGRITVMDGDAVENSNLQRQIIHSDARIGTNKAESAAVAMRALNPFVAVTALARHLGPDDDVGPYDLILDGTDNFDTRYLVNRLAARAGRPLIAGAITQWEGQIGLYDPARGTACYECVFPVRPAPGLAPSCAEAGVAAPLPGIIGAMMATEAIKHLTGAGQGLADRLILHDALYAETRSITVHPRADCPICREHRTVSRS
ncbi:HesA/MoeB/ThiF family protein [Cereibacter sp. SYSU M97828]|nr:HesA/MoeB/ThiF family protein [Cereibacter flavus]